MNEDPEKMFLTDSRPVLQSLSGDLLQQALHEVSSVQEVKEEPGVYNRMEVEQILVNHEVGLAEISHIHSSDSGPNSLDKVKVEPLPPLVGGRGAVDSMILIPSLQSDGTVAYAVQQTIPVPVQQRQPLINPTSSVISTCNTSPCKLPNSVPILRNTQNKPKNILPKTFQPGPPPAKQHKPVVGPMPILTSGPTVTPSVTPTPNTMTQILAPVPQGFGPRVRAPTEAGTVLRKLEMRRSDGQTVAVNLSYSGAEVSIRSEQPLSQLELQHVQCAIRQAQPSQQLYRLLTPPHIVNLEGESSQSKEQDKEQHFSVAAFVREFSKNRPGRGKKHSRGRPRKGTSKINEKKVITELRREFGIREDKVKEFGLVGHTDDNTDQSQMEVTFQASNQSRTRSGRLSRPPPRIRKDPNENDNIEKIPLEPELNENFSRDNNGAISGPITNMNFEPPPKVDDQIQLPNRRNFIPPAKYICKVCGKLYLGDKKIAKHLKHFPSHEFATPEPPIIQAAKDIKKGQSFESYISECDANSFIEQIGPKLFKSFSLWDLLVHKTITKRLGTVESLMSLMSDMQAVVMELKNLVEQCLSCERTNQDSFSVQFTPIMSSVLGLSQSGGATRFVLPYTQIPEHYHKLLSFPTGLRGANIVSSSTHPNLMSPESTNSIIHPEEENSQMSLSSDILDQSLGDKVVLEDNLGTRQIQEMDEDTQDSSIIAPSPGNPHKRQRLDSESHSVTSPTPQTPDFLSQGDDSNLSLSSISPAVTESVQIAGDQDIQKKNVNIESSAIISSVCSSVGSLHTKLPSFSSIINGSPKETERTEADEATGGPVTSSLFSAEADSEVDFTGSSTALTTSSNTTHMLPLQSNRVACLNPEPFSVPSVRTESLGGSAPVSPRVSYGGSHLVPYNRRCSLDNINRSSPQDILALSAKLQHSTAQSLLDIAEEADHGHTALPAININVPDEFSCTEGNTVVVTSVWAPPPSTQQFSVMSGYIKLSTPESFQQSRQQLTAGSNSPSGTEFEHLPISKSSILKAVPKQQTFPQGTSTHVTFSEELTHPIPSVSPAKDFRDIDLKRHPSESQSSSIFSDLESVLNEASDFSFHSELADSERLQVKTPDKLLASVPPAVIMDNKKSAITFDNILEFDKNNEGKAICNQPATSNENPEGLTILTQNILENQPDFSFNDSSATGT